MKRIASVFLILLGIAVSAAAQESAVASKRLNFAYTHGSPDYVDLSSLGGNVFPAGIDNQMIKARNLKSFVVNFRGWRLLDEYIVDPEFFWELDPIALKGRIRTVHYSKISKYPSLEKRYKAIRPVGVNYIVCVDLNSTDQDGEAASSRFRPHQVCFRAQSYQMFWGPSRSGRAASYPGALLGWKEGISTASLASRFHTTDNSDVNRLKNIVSKFRSVAKYSGSPTNTWLDIRWPDDAIDKIYEDFEEYEKEGKDLEKKYKEAKEEPKAAKRAQPLAADDEMAHPYQGAPKSAKSFEQGRLVGLVSPSGKKVFTSERGNKPVALNDEGSFFSFGNYDADYFHRTFLLNAAGKFVKIDGIASFHSIVKNPDGKTYSVYVFDGATDLYRTAKCYAFWDKRLEWPMSAQRFADFQKFDKESPERPTPPKPGETSKQKFFRSILHLTVDSKFKVLDRARAYALIYSAQESCS